MKDAVIADGPFKNVVDPFRLGIGNEYLTEAVVTDKLNDTVNPLVVKLIENIVEQEHRLVVFD